MDFEPIILIPVLLAMFGSALYSLCYNQPSVGNLILEYYNLIYESHIATSDDIEICDIYLESVRGYKRIVERWRAGRNNVNMLILLYKVHALWLESDQNKFKKKLLGYVEYMDYTLERIEKNACRIQD